MEAKKMLEILRESGLTLISAGCDSWVEGYRGLRPNVLNFINNPSEFSESKHNCLIISENGNLIEANVKAAYKFFITQKLCLPRIV